MKLTVKHFSELTADELYGLLQLRTAVFVVEQQCIYQDLDGKDRHCLHVWATDGQGVAGCLRVLPAGIQGETAAIGRVVTRERGQGVGRELMEAGIEAAQRVFGARVIRLEAQTYARGFYEKFGFRQISDEFLEDGIPHIQMERAQED